MDWNGRGVRAGAGDQLATLKVGQGALDRAAGEAGARGDRLMGDTDGPIRLLGCMAIEVEVNDERGQAPVVAHQVGQKSIVLTDIVACNATCEKWGRAPFASDQAPVYLRQSVPPHCLITTKGEP
jgi:hypothetical protein